MQPHPKGTLAPFEDGSCKCSLPPVLRRGLLFSFWIPFNKKGDIPTSYMFPNPCSTLEQLRKPKSAKTRSKTKLSWVDTTHTPRSLRPHYFRPLGVEGPRIYGLGLLGHRHAETHLSRSSCLTRSRAAFERKRTARHEFSAPRPAGHLPAHHLRPRLHRQRPLRPALRLWCRRELILGFLLEWASSSHRSSGLAVFIY